MAVVIKGLDSLMQKLDAMGGNVMGALTKAVKTTYEAAQKDAQANIHNRSGDLGRSITFNSHMVVTDDKAEGIVAANMPYADYVERGTEDEFGNVRNPPYPYMMPALEANKPVFEGESRKELNKAIRKMCK
jgi:HK97 gp10 family phage protein